MVCSSAESRDLLFCDPRTPAFDLNQHDRKLIGRSIVSLDRDKVYNTFVFETKRTSRVQIVQVVQSLRSVQAV
jgi:hypothetical protein